MCCGGLCFFLFFFFFEWYAYSSLRGFSLSPLFGQHGVICVDNKETYAFYMFCERFVMDRFMLSPYVRGVRGSLDAIMLIVLAGAFALLTVRLTFCFARLCCWRVYLFW